MARLWGITLIVAIIIVIVSFILVTKPSFSWGSMAVIVAPIVFIIGAVIPIVIRKIKLNKEQKNSKVEEFLSIIEASKAEQVETQLESILKGYFNSCGIKTESVSLNRIELVDDTIVPVPVDEKTIALGLPDSDYQLILHNVVISTENKPSIRMPWLSVDLNYKYDKWFTREVHVEEEISEEDKILMKGLLARQKVITVSTQLASNLITMVGKVAQYVIEQFG